MCNTLSFMLFSVVRRTGLPMRARTVARAIVRVKNFLPTPPWRSWPGAVGCWVIRCSAVQPVLRTECAVKMIFAGKKDMETIKTLWKYGRIYGKKYGWLVTIGSLLFLCVQLYYWKPPPNVGLEFEASMLGFMRPDFGLADDLKKFGFKNPSKKTIGMATYDMMMGRLRNVGNKDADNVE